MNRLAVRLPGLEMKNPVMPASGCFGFGQEYARFYDLSVLGACVLKAATKQPRLGNKTPRVAETPSGMLNAIGLQNPGAETIITQHVPQLARYNIPVLANVAGDTLEDYVETTKILCRSPYITALELNVSCPNVKRGGIAFGVDRKMLRELTKAVKESATVPVYVKLSPHADDIVAAALTVEEAGADGISLINTVLGMRLDRKSGQPILANGTGGLSGPAIKPLAVRIIYEVSRAVRLPIIGMGGIETADDVIEFLSAGASAVAVGTAHFVDPFVCPKIIGELEQKLDEIGAQRVTDIIGRSWKKWMSTHSS